MKRIPPDAQSLIQGLLSSDSRRIAIVTHVNPDGDAIGSMLALYHILFDMGHHINCISPNLFPEFLAWMPGCDKITIYNTNQKTSNQLLDEADIIFCLDFNKLNRLRYFGQQVESSAALKILIDHHPEPETFAQVTYSDTSVSSTAELLYYFILDTGYGHLLNKNAATCLFAGIMTDTGCFSYNSSQPTTYEVVKQLLTLGIEKDKIYNRVYDAFSYYRMRLLGYLLNEKMEYFPDYGAALISLTREEQKRFKFSPGDSEGIVNYPLMIKGVDFAALFIEKEDHIKLSLRSKGHFDVNEFAKNHFNGGGHKNASGGEFKESMESTLAKFRSLLTFNNPLQTITD